MTPVLARSARRFLALIVIATACCSMAHACNVPVFRYALENWAPDKYRGVVFHRGPLEPKDKEQLARLQEQADASLVNLAIRTVEIGETIPTGDEALLASLGDAEFPLLVVQYPAALQLDVPVWSGSLDDGTLDKLLDSPARREVLRRLSLGQTAVWVMIDSGDAGQDEAAATLLDEQLAALRQTLKLPELTDSPEDAIQDGPALRIEFSLLRIRRNDPAEATLIDLLLAAESDLATLSEPMVFPVFGRGRAMLPLVGAGISEANVRDSAKFLTGACSCQVKELNPGFDLLASADWTDLLPWAKRPADRNLGNIGTPPSSEPEFVPIPSGTTNSSVPSPATDQAAPTAETERPPAAPPSKAQPAASSEFNWTAVILPGLLGVALVMLVLAAKRRPA